MKFGGFVLRQDLMYTSWALEFLIPLICLLNTGFVSVSSHTNCQFCCLFVLQIRTHAVVQANLTLIAILLPQPPKCWAYKCELLGPAFIDERLMVTQELLRTGVSRW